MSIMNDYLKFLGKDEIPSFLEKYLSVPSLLRLKKIGYFCGMDYASKDVYDFTEYISRYDHSLSVALLTWKFTQNKCATISALFHDISTPCFSHVIDYMNKDYSEQESTEEYTLDILKSDLYFLECLKSDNIDLSEIDFKKYEIVDNKRPRLCTDRLDGVILTGMFWVNNLSFKDAKRIVTDIEVYNLDGKKEIGFKSNDILKLVLKVNEEIDIFCHSKEDNYMMELLAHITKEAIDKNIIKYSDLFILDEIELFNILDKANDENILNKLYKFRNIKVKDIPDIELSDVKIRILKPIVQGIRIG